MDLRALSPDPIDPSGNLRRRLDDPALPLGATAVASLALGRDLARQFSGIGWTLAAGVSTNAGIHLVDSRRGLDPDGVVGQPPQSPGPGSGPLVATPSGHVHLKWLLAGKASMDVSRPGRTGIRLDGSADVRAGAYLAFPAERTLGEAMAEGMAGLPLIFDPRDLAALDVGDACFVELGGRLTTRIEVDWAGLLAGPLGPLRSLAVSGAPLDFALDVNAGARVELALEDSFRLAFAGLGEGWVRVALHRADSRAFSLGAGLRLEAGFSDPEAARAVLAAVGAGLLAPVRQALGTVDAAISDALAGVDDCLASLRARIGQQSASLDQYFDAHGLQRGLARIARLQSQVEAAARVDAALAERLSVPLDQAAAILEAIDGLADDLARRLGDRLDASIEALGLPALAEDARAAVAGLLERLDRIEAGLAEVAGHRIRLGLDYSYRRVATGSSLFEADLDTSATAFEDWHARLLALDLTPLIDASVDASLGIRPRLYLHSRSESRRSALGLGLGEIADRSFWGRDWLEVERHAATDLPGGRLRREHSLVLLGHRGHEDRLFNTARCRGDFDARLEREDDAPGRWRHTLGLRLESSTPVAGADWLHAAADFGALWGIVPEGGVDALAEALGETGALGEPAGLTVTLVLGNAVFAEPRFLQTLASLDDATAASAFAAALPTLPHLPQRRDPAARRAAYASAMRVVTGTAGIDLGRRDRIAKGIAQRLVGADARLRDFERRADPGSVAHIIRSPSGGRVEGCLRELRQAGTRLGQLSGPAHGGPEERRGLLQALVGLDLGWINRFVLRWQGVLLRQIALSSGVDPEAIEARLVLTIGSGQEARQHVLVGR